MDMYSDAMLRAGEYAKRNGVSIVKQLGGGIQGVVFSTDADTAIKALIQREFYVRERDVYLGLRERQVDRVGQFWVPQLTQFADDLLVIEMEIVRPPFVLDFASAYLDAPPPYADDREIMGAWEAEKLEQFEDRWPEVRRIIWQFRSYGIYLADVKPGNIAFAD